MTSHVDCQAHADSAEVIEILGDCLQSLRDHIAEHHGESPEVVQLDAALRYWDGVNESGADAPEWPLFWDYLREHMGEWWC